MTLTLPAGDVAGFGAALAASTDDNNDYLVVGAPDANGAAGRAFLYVKAHSSGSFSAPVELFGESGRFGASVDILYSVIAIGAPNAFSGRGAVNTYSHTRDAAGFPQDTGSFRPDDLAPQFQLGGSMGTSVSLSWWPPTLTACGSHCETVYQVYTGTPGLLPYVFWHQIGPQYAGDGGFQMSSAMLIHESATVISVYDLLSTSGTTSYSFSPDARFGPPGGIGVFSSQMAGLYDLFLTGVSSPGSPSLGTKFYAYVMSNPFGSPPALWALGSGTPVLSVTQPAVGTQIAESGDTWLVSNASGAATTGSGVVYQISLNRNGSYYDYTNDSWTQVQLASGGPKFGAGLAVTSTFMAIGDPGTTQVYALNNGQQLITKPYRSDGTGSVTVTMTLLAGSPDPVIHEDPSCTTVPRNVFQSNIPNSPCLQVTLKAQMVGAAQVCWTNPAPDPNARIFRCEPAAPSAPFCSAGETFSSGYCCALLPGPIGLNPTCANTDHFSSLGFGIPADTDGDGTPDIGDNCPTVSNLRQTDADNDGIGDPCDNCPTTFNPDQLDTNHNGIGDACEVVAAAAPVPASSGPGSFLLMLALAVVAVVQMRDRRAFRSRGGDDG